MVVSALSGFLHIEILVYFYRILLSLLQRKSKDIDTSEFDGVNRRDSICKYIYVYIYMYV
jgi:hypothetical protein